METKTALVLGATGGIGGEVARRLQARGWLVRALHRNPQGARAGGFEWVKGDAMSGSDVLAAAQGARLIVHAVNPPGYRGWGKLVLPMLDNTIAAAAQTHARILLPGTIYNFGPDAFPVLGEDSPQNPVTAKGRIRAEMERRLERAAGNGTVRALIVRAGDFFGPRAANNWFSQGLVKPGRPVAAVTNPGRPGIGHQWAYLPDVAETMIRLIEEDQGDDFARFHMEGFWDADGMGMVEAIRRAVNRPDLPVRALPWTTMRLASPFVPLFRELTEMRYLWREPLRMTNARLVAALGSEPQTPIDEAVRATLVGLGCLPVASMPASGRAALADGRA